MSEEQFRRLKQLSSAQSIFLKAYLAKKVANTSALIEETVRLIENKGSANDEKLAAIRANLAALKLSELDVDAGKAEAMVRDELALLRGSVETPTASGGVQPAAVAAPVETTSAADAEKLAGLERENKRLAEQLTDATARSKSDAGSLAGELAAALAQLKAKDEAIRAKEDIIRAKEDSLRAKDDSLKAKDEELRNRDAEIRRRDEAVAAKNGELEALQLQMRGAQESSLAAGAREMDALRLELDASRKELSATRAQQETERAAAAAQVKGLEARLESEKEELMDAMAQEVEAVEKARADDAATLQGELDRLRATLAASKGSSQRVATHLASLQQASRDLAQNRQELSVRTKKDLQEMRVALLNGFKGEFEAKLRNSHRDYLALKDKYLKEMGERRRLHNIVAELKGNIRVYMRCRPPTKRELDQFGAESTCVSFDPLAPSEVRVTNNDKGRDKTWEFDEVFDFNTTQKDVYKEVSSLVTSVLDGFNVCIFAYGQTGSGKTYTMSGPAEDFGVNTRALEDLFARMDERRGEFRDTVSVSLLEVYNEDIRDLLVDARSAGKLEVKQGEFGNYVPGLTSVDVTNLGDVINLFAVGDRNRASASTNMNEHSSRSHMMLTVSLTTESLATGATTRGKLNLVDLAGSERIDKSGATGLALKEAQNINQSLSALGDVIQARGNKQAHIPFRNSTLTYLLQDSLSKDSKTLMFVCVSPVSFNAEETFCSLNFAARVRAVELGKAAKNVITPSGGGSSGSASTKGSEKVVLDSRRSTLGKK